MERCGAAIRPCKGFRTVVGAVNHDGVIGDSGVIELLEHPADHIIVLDHTVRVEVNAGAALAFLFQTCPDVRAGGVVPYKEK
jgi:hypothetical protein